MASKKGSVINVIVCGLTTASFQGLTGQGAGKSYLCNRFVRPKYDELREHTSVLNNSDFGSNIINQNHFLYWGGKTVGLEDGQEVTIQLVEHTEFVDDSTFKPFTHSKPYHKRCTQLKLHSGGKVMYISDDQLALPEEYTDVPKFPDKFSIDGFILCVDVSTPLDVSTPQREFVTRLLQAIQQTKKPVVVAMTKYDSAIEESVASVSELVSKSKKQIPLIEVSAINNINVDACFLVLCHLVDPKKPKTKLTTFADAKSHLDERIRKIEEAFQSLLHREVSDFSQNIFQVCKDLQSQSEYELLLELKGLERIYRLVRGQLAFLKRQQLESKLMRYVELLPLILDTLIPNLSLNDNIESCCTSLRSSSKFGQYFEDVREWRDDNDLLKSSNKDTVPYGLMLEDIGHEVLQNHIDKVLKIQREETAFNKIQDVLHNARGLIPGTKQIQLWEELGVTEECRLVGGDRLTKIYLEHMSEVLRECVADLKELILERIDLFEEQLVGDIQQTIDKVDTELKDCPRYKRLDCRADVRKGQVLKYIGSVQVGDSASQARSHIRESLERMSREKLLRRELLRPPAVSVRPPGELQWNLYTDSEEYLNLSLLARTLDNVLTLRSDFMNHLPGSGLFDVGGQSYRLDMSLFHGEEGPIQSMTNHDYIPDGAVAVVNSMECIDWLEDVLTRLWVPEVMTSLPPYRGMPLVILALDKEADDSEDSDTPLHRRAKSLAARVQATCITERPTIQPKRLVVSTVIVQLLNAIMEVVLPTATFFISPLPVNDHQGLNIAVCSVVDDPYSAMDLLSPWLRHQTVCFDQNKLFVHSNLDKMLRICTLSFHSALDVKEIVSFTRLGLILAYSPSRPASLAIIKFLLSKLPAVPKMIIAIVSEESCDNHMMSEGRQVAEKCDAVFVSTNDPEWTIGYTAEFFSKCWFGRFTSWSSQTMPEDVVSRQREKRQARALPSRPVSDIGLPVSPPKRTRHSIGVLLDEESPPPSPSYPSGTVPRPSRERYNRKPTSVPSPPLLPDSGIYSDPISADIGIKQMKAATLERKRSSVTDPGAIHIRPLLSPDITDSPFPEGDYASVEDAMRFQGNSLAMFNTLERQRQTLRSPSMSPPPVPLSPTDTEISIINGGSDEDEPNDMYATVQTTRRQSTKLASNTRGYDHLEASPEVQRKKLPNYDRLNPPPIPSRTDSLPVTPRQAPPTLPTPSQTTSLEDMYATVDLSAKTRRPPPTHGRRKSEDNTLNNGALYSTVNKTPRTKPKPPPRRAATLDEPVYSLPEKVVRGRRSPPTPAKTPPPIAPKPPKRSPTGRLPRVNVRAESFNTGVRTKPLLLSDVGRSYSVDKRPVIKSPLIPSREHSFTLGQRTSSLPRDYCHGIQQNGHALTRSLECPLVEDDIPSLPVRRYQPTDMDLDDEAPPLPPRDYNYSDFEDNDDELFQSEDELDDHSWTVSDQQKLYATITQATQRIDSISGVEAVYHVVNKMVLMNDNEQVARQSSMTQEEESAYDTLENVLKSMRTEGHTPYSPTHTEGGQRSMVTLPQQGNHATPPQARPPPSSGNQAQGLQSTPLTAGEIKNLRKTQKLLKQLEKQAQKEAARRHARETKKRKRDDDEKRRKDGKKRTRKGKKEPERNRYFGSPLEGVVDEGGVPVFVRKCVEFVEREGLRSEGIYRVPGKKDNVLLLQDKYEENHDLDFTSLEIYESAVSSTLKSFFKLLPDPLIAESVAAQLLVVNSLDADSQKTRVHELLSSLPHPNIKTLKFMMEHLHHIQEEHEVNKMTPSNLSIVFWPTLMRPPLMDLADPSKQLGWQLIMTRMIQCPDFVPNVN